MRKIVAVLWVVFAVKRFRVRQYANENEYSELMTYSQALVYAQVLGGTVVIEYRTKIKTNK